MKKTFELPILFLLLGCLSSCGPRELAVETVPASVLDPDRNPPPTPAIRKKYKLSNPDTTPLFPAPADAYTTDSGLKFVVFKRGKSNRHPLALTKVTVHYEGYTTDGKVFDSSIARKQPASFVLTQVIPGWREGVKLMTVGDSFRFWIPEKDAYRGMPGKPAGLLIFNVELLEMEAE